MRLSPGSRICLHLERRILDYFLFFPFHSACIWSTKCARGCETFLLSCHQSPLITRLAEAGNILNLSRQYVIQGNLFFFHSHIADACACIANCETFLLSRHQIPLITRHPKPVITRSFRDNVNDRDQFKVVFFHFTPILPMHAIDLRTVVSIYHRRPPPPFPYHTMRGVGVGVVSL